MRKRRLPFDVCFWSHASSVPKSAATNFIELDKHLDYLKAIAVKPVPTVIFA